LNSLRLDLETLEVEHLDVTVTELSGGIELLGMGHASPELSQSCSGGSACSDSTCACKAEYGTGASCVESECHCNEAGR
jgi:hypothetical protein